MYQWYLQEKQNQKNLDKDKYESEVYSYTKEKTYKIMVSKRYLNENENILIIDDFYSQWKSSRRTNRYSR